MPKSESSRANYIRPKIYLFSSSVKEVQKWLLSELQMQRNSGFSDVGLNVWELYNEIPEHLDANKATIRYALEDLCKKGYLVKYYKSRYSRPHYKTYNEESDEDDSDSTE